MAIDQTNVALDIAVRLTYLNTTSTGGTTYKQVLYKLRD